jgi:hypothetical protein
MECALYSGNLFLKSRRSADHHVSRCPSRNSRSTLVQSLGLLGPAHFSLRAASPGV